MDDLVVPCARVEAALRDGRPVVALETSVLAQGLPHPRNLEAASAMASAVTELGAVPAWVWIDGGALRIGFGDEGRDLERIATSGRAAKVARRDLPMAVAGGGLGATTVSATLWVAARAGIEIAATGGIGGVHRVSGDVSADLLEMARTPGTIVCSGPKSIVDAHATLERLEELGVGVLGYRCDRLPFFFVRESDLPLEHRADTPDEVARVARARASLGVASALLVCNPIPEEAAPPPDRVTAAVEECLRRAREGDVSGKAVTPFLLGCVADRTGGATLEANIALLRANASLAAAVAVALAS